MKVSIVGAAGCLGSSAAFNIATQGLADEMVLLDIRRNVLESHAQDIRDALVACGQDIDVRTGNHEDMTGSDVVIVVGGVSLISKVSTSEGKTKPHQAFYSRQQVVSENLSIIRDITQAIQQFCPDAIVITGTNPVEALNYASYLLSPNRDRKKFIGYSLNDSLRFRLWVAEAIGVKPSQVEAIVMGEHGDSQVPIFSSIRVDNQPISLSEPVKQELRRKPAERMHRTLSLKAGRTTGWSSGLGLAAILKAIRNDTGEMFPCCTVLAGEYGYEGFSMTVPLILGRQGIHEVLEWKLDPEEKEGLERSVSILKTAAHYVEETLGTTSKK